MQNLFRLPFRQPQRLIRAFPSAGHRVPGAFNHHLVVLPLPGFPGDQMPRISAGHLFCLRACGGALVQLVGDFIQGMQPLFQLMEIGVSFHLLVEGSHLAGVIKDPAD